MHWGIVPACHWMNLFNGPFTTPKSAITKRRKKGWQRIENDFYTSTNLGSLWGELIVASTLNLLTDLDPQNFTFVEIAAEPDSTILEDIEHPFRDHLIIRLGRSHPSPRKIHRLQ